MTKIPKLPILPVSGAPPHAFLDEGALVVSAEHGDQAADYYGEFRGGYPWIEPKLEAWAKKRGGYWEWRNAGCIAFYKA